MTTNKHQKGKHKRHRSQSPIFTSDASTSFSTCASAPSSDRAKTFQDPSDYPHGGGSDSDVKTYADMSGSSKRGVTILPDSAADGISGGKDRAGAKDGKSCPQGRRSSIGQAPAPAIHLHECIAGLFEDGEHSIGRSYTEAALQHWRSLDTERKGQLLSGITREDVYECLRDVEITTQFPVEGEPREETGKAVAQQFLHAMEVQDGVFRFPSAPSLEFVGFFASLERNLLMSMEEENLRNQAAMVGCLLLWRQSWWMYAIIPVVLLLLLENAWCRKARSCLWELLSQSFLRRRRWQPYVRWKVEAYSVAALSIAMASQSKWCYKVTLLFIGLVLFLDYRSASSTSLYADSKALVTVRQLLLHLQKFLLLYLAYHSYVALFTVCLSYFPTFTVLLLSSVYFLAGLGISLFWQIVHDKLLSYFPRWRDSLDAWWQDGRDGLNRAMVLALIAVTVIPYTFYSSWNTIPAWRGTFWRFLSVMVVTNLASVEDLKRTYNAGKESARNVMYRMKRGLKRWSAFSRDGNKAPKTCRKAGKMD